MIGRNDPLFTVQLMRSLKVAALVSPEQGAASRAPGVDVDADRKLSAMFGARQRQRGEGPDITGIPFTPPPKEGSL